MLIYAVVGCVALLTAFLTLFSGFGLGTLLMPAFALFFPLPVAIASTAVVHGANNLLKVSLLYRYIDKQVMLKFGVPAVLSAIVGAFILSQLVAVEQLFHWQVFQFQFETTLIKVVLGALILAFALFDLSPLKNKFQFHTKWLPVGGVLSGFFGGLSGHQGAFRSMFLLNCKLDPKAFVATQSIIATAVDTTRFIIYLAAIFLYEESEFSIDSMNMSVVVFATICAFLGTYFGKKLLEKTKIALVRWVAACLLLLIGAGLITGIL